MDKTNNSLTWSVYFAFLVYWLNMTGLTQSIYGHGLATLLLLGLTYFCFKSTWGNRCGIWAAIIIVWIIILGVDYQPFMKQWNEKFHPQPKAITEYDPRKITFKIENRIISSNDEPIILRQRMGYNLFVYNENETIKAHLFFHIKELKIEDMSDFKGILLIDRGENKFFFRIGNFEIQQSIASISLKPLSKENKPTIINFKLNIEPY